LFDEQVEIDAEQVKRASVERSVSGLDGVLSIDLGRRGRKIIQRGELRAASSEQLRKLADEILAFQDGKVHKLQTESWEVFEDLRMDSFKVSGERQSGAGLVADYEIEYMQLRV
jgi:hypothetical protein